MRYKRLAGYPALVHQLENFSEVVNAVTRREYQLQSLFETEHRLKLVVAETYTHDNDSGMHRGDFNAALYHSWNTYSFDNHRRIAAGNALEFRSWIIDLIAINQYVCTRLNRQRQASGIQL